MQVSLEKCSCSGGNLDKLVKPTVLGLLAEGPQHGYALMARLVECGIFCECEQPDASGVYRVLGEMEKQGLVNAQWDLTSRGPARRIYSLTAHGMQCLEKWDRTLEVYQKRITKIRRLIHRVRH